MKTFKTILAVGTAVLLAMALFASPSSAALGTDDQATVSGNLYFTPVDDTKTKLDGPFTTGQQVKLYANYPDGVRNVTFYKKNGDTWQTIGTDPTGTNGNAYLTYTIASGDQTIFAEDGADLESNTRTITGDDGPPPGSSTLTASSSAKTFTATFSPVVSGQSATLRTREICTYETDETNPASGEFNKDVPQADCVGPLKTVATGKQSSTGKVTFTISNPLEVAHDYQAFSGSSSTNVLEDVAAPLPTKPFGIDTGLSEVHFNTYEGDNVNTRTRYFEGAFSMTSSERNASPTGTPCAEAAGGDTGANPIMQSAMKGRGNYSWSFPKKSFTLKLGESTSLCGLDKSKKYALVANDYDKSLLRNQLASFVGQKFSNMGWTPKAVPVEFYMNGDYRGSYLLIERIAIEGGKLDIKELNGDDEEEQIEPKITGGYIMEWDFRRGADHNVYLGSDSGYVGIKEPEHDLDREGDNTGEGISDAQLDWIADHLRDADNAMRANSCQSGSWDDFIDMDSAVDYYIAMEYMKPVDGNMWASVYMYKPRGEKIHFGPMWDFDLAAGSATRAGNVASTSGFYLRNNLQVSAMQPESATTKPDTWFNCLNKRKSFRDAVSARWDQVIAGDLGVGGFLDTQKALISKSAEANYKEWSHSSRISSYQVIKSSWSSDVSYLKSWAVNRRQWLNGSTGF